MAIRIAKAGQSLGEAVVGGGAAAGADGAGFDEAFVDEGGDDVVGGAGFGTAEGHEQAGAREPAIGLGGGGIGASSGELVEDAFGEGGFGAAQRLAGADQGQGAVDVDAVVGEEVDGARHGLAGEGDGRIVGMPEGVEDEGEAGEMARQLAVETAEDDRRGGGEIDVFGAPGDPAGVGLGRENDGKARWYVGCPGDGAQRAEPVDDGFELREGGQGEIEPGQVTGGKDEEEALEKAILILAANAVEEGGLEAADDADDGMGNGGGELGAVGEDRLGGPEREVVLAILAAAAVHGADEAVELVAEEGEAGGVLEGVGQAGDRAGVDEKAIEAGPGQAPATPTPPVGLGPPARPLLIMEDIEGQTGDADGGGLADAGEGDEGGPEGGALVPAGTDGEPELAADGGTDEGKEGGSSERDGDVGGAGVGRQPLGDERRQGVERVGRIGFEDARRGAQAGEVAFEDGDGIVDGVGSGHGAQSGGGDDGTRAPGAGLTTIEHVFAFSKR